MNIDTYPNKEAVWGYDDITILIQDRIDRMPDLPRRVVILLSWKDSEDASIREHFEQYQAIYDVLAMKWFDVPFRLFFLSLTPDSTMTGDNLIDALSSTAFSECFLLRDGKAVLKTIRMESLEEAQRKHSQALSHLMSEPDEDDDLDQP